MKNKYTYIFIALLVLFNIYAGYKQISLRKQLERVNEISSELINRSIASSDKLKNIITTNYYVTRLTSKNPDVHRVLNQDKVVLYITEGNCGSCIQEALNYMDNLSGVIGKDNILFMGNFKTIESFNSYANGLSSFIGNYVLCTDAGFPDELNAQPLVFIADENLNIKSLYVPDFYPQYAEEYYTKVIPSNFLEN